MPKVSVIVPVYNAEKYLQECVDSILRQTLADLELILVDDGSTDSSPAICDRYAEQDARVKVIRQANAGLSAARNRGIEVAAGEWVAFVDSDDFVDKNMFEQMYLYAKNNKYDIVVCDTINVYNDKQSYRISNLKYSDDDVKNYIISPPMACIRIYKKNIFEKVSFKEGIL